MQNMLLQHFCKLATSYKGLWLLIYTQVHSTLCRLFVIKISLPYDCIFLNRTTKEWVLCEQFILHVITIKEVCLDKVIYYQTMTNA